MKIGIIGSGDVGQSLGKGLAALGHDVMIGSRTPESDPLKSWKKSIGKRASTGSLADTATYGQILFIAVAWSGIEEALQQVRPESAGKIVIDVTNPLELSETSPPRLAVGHSISGGEIVQQLLSDCHVVKTLNTVNHAHMAQPHYYEGSPAMFYCGNNPSAKKAVAKILSDLGWKDATDIGDITKSRLLEPLCLLRVNYGMIHNTWDHAFGVLKR